MQENFYGRLDLASTIPLNSVIERNSYTVSKPMENHWHSYLGKCVCRQELPMHHTPILYYITIVIGGDWL